MKESSGRVLGVSRKEWRVESVEIEGRRVERRGGWGEERRCGKMRRGGTEEGREMEGGMRGKGRRVEGVRVREVRNNICAIYLCTEVVDGFWGESPSVECC